MGNVNGFSILEMMIVVAIAASMTLFAMFGIGGLTNRLDVQNESIRFRDALLSARNVALVSGQCVTVTTAPQQVTVQTFAPTPNCAGLGAATSTKIINLAAFVTLAAFDTGNPLVFNTNGGTIYNRPSSTTLNGPNRGYRFFVYPAIGQVRYQ
jgi:prepilin-type N-terminal cleavage/methylation domain-containing protein